MKNSETEISFCLAAIASAPTRLRSPAAALFFAPEDRRAAPLVEVFFEPAFFEPAFLGALLAAFFGAFLAAFLAAFLGAFLGAFLAAFLGFFFATALGGPSRSKSVGVWVSVLLTDCVGSGSSAPDLGSLQACCKDAQRHSS